MTKEERAERAKHYTHLGVEIPKEQHDRIRALAKSKEITISQFVRRALNEYLVKQ